MREVTFLPLRLAAISFLILRQRPGTVRSAALRRSAFNLLKSLFDWIEIGRIFRQIKQPRTRSDDLLHSDTFVGREIVYDDEVAAPERRLQTLFGALPTAKCSPRSAQLQPV